MSARRFLEGLDIPSGAREALLARVEISSANSADVVAARDLAGLAHVDDEPAPSVAGGNDRLARALAEELGSSVRLSSPVERIAWNEDGVRVSAGGHELDAAACVVAVPASVLGGIEFDPGLPAELAQALAEVRMGHAAKLFVPLRAPAPPTAVMSVPERYWCWTATGPDDTTQAVVSCFAGSPRALERLETAEGPKRWLDSLAALRPELDLDRADAMVSTWDDDRWVRGAYSTSPPISLADLAARPIGPLAFAGEHLGGPYAALMEGAIRSGRRAAEALLDAARARLGVVLKVHQAPLGPLSLVSDRSLHARGTPLPSAAHGWYALLVQSVRDLLQGHAALMHLEDVLSQLRDVLHSRSADRLTALARRLHALAGAFLESAPLPIAHGLQGPKGDATGFGEGVEVRLDHDYPDLTFLEPGEHFAQVGRGVPEAHELRDHERMCRTRPQPFDRVCQAGSLDAGSWRRVDVPYDIRQLNAESVALGLDL